MEDLLGVVVHTLERKADLYEYKSSLVYHKSQATCPHTEAHLVVVVAAAVAKAMVF